MLRLKQAGIVAAGLVVAAIMVLLGLWQMSVYRHTGQQVAIDRTQQEVVALAEAVAPDGTVADIYARRVSVEGHYRPELQTLVGVAWPLRVVTALELDDGRLLAVVRGQTASADARPAPSGRQSIVGVFLASDPVAPDATVDVPAGTLSSVRLAKLAQDWPGKVIAGYITLSDADAAAQGLQAATPPLPEVKGSAQNSGYALQWWVFAALSLGGSVLIARGAGRKGGAAS